MDPRYHYKTLARPSTSTHVGIARIPTDFRVAAVGVDGHALLRHT